MTKETDCGHVPIITKLLRQAVCKPDSTVFIHDGRKYSTAFTASRIISITNVLKQKNFPTNTLALCNANSPEFIFSFLAGNLLGLNVQVFNVGWPNSLLRKTIAVLRPDWFLHNGVGDLQQSSVFWAEIPQDEFSSSEISQITQELAESHELSRAFYTGFTSGSGGVPKGFVRSEKSWLDSFSLDEKEFDFSGDDVFACPGSFAHSLFLYALLRGFYLGVPVLTFSRFRPAQIVRQMQASRATVIYAVPTQLQALYDAARAGKIDLSSIRLVLSSGAKLSDKLRQSLAKTFPAAQVCEFYGSSELSYVSVSKPADNPPPGSVGRVLPGIDIKILDDDGKVCERGESGRLFIKSPLRFIGYAVSGGDTGLRNMVSNRGFLACGDTGYLDENGFLFVTGRSDRIIIASGRTINPEEIETVLILADGVEQAAVVPISDPRRGQRLVAIVKLSSEVTLGRKALMAFCAERLPDYMVPRMYYQQNQWPLTVSHKSDFPQLQEQLNGKQLSKLENR